MRDRILIPAVVVVLAVLPLVLDSPFTLHNLILIFMYAGLSSAWNILGGFAGQVSLGHTAFFGLGAYTSTILFVKYGISPWFGLVAAVGVSLLGALIISVPVLRLRGPFFTLATIAFAEVLRLIAIYWRNLTEGSVGLTIPFTPGWEWLVFQGKLHYYYISLFLAVVAFGIARSLYRSRLGYALRALKADVEAAEVLGVDTTRAQLAAVLLSAGITGLIGVFYAQYVYFIDPDTAFSMTLFSVQPALNSIIGGMGSVWGPVLGSALMAPLGEFLRSYLGSAQQGLNYFIYGVVLIVVVMVMPNGIVSVPGLIRRRLGRGRRGAAQAEAVPKEGA